MTEQQSDAFWTSIEAEAPSLDEVFPHDYEDIPDPPNLKRKVGIAMANHFKGRQCLFELDERGNLTIHTDGRHITIPAYDVAAMLRWLNKKHDEAVAKEQEMQRRSTWERKQKLARDRGLLNLFGETGDEPENA